MPVVQRVKVTVNLEPWVWEEIKNTAEAQGRSASQFMEELMRWGVRAEHIEGLRQGVELHLDELYRYLVETATEYHWGPVAPSLAIPREVGNYLDVEIDENAARMELDDADPDALEAAVRRVIEAMKAKGEI